MPKVAQLQPLFKVLGKVTTWLGNEAHETVKHILLNTKDSFLEEDLTVQFGSMEQHKPILRDLSEFVSDGTLAW